MNFEDILHRRSINNTGFDNTTGNMSGRILNKDGSSNVIKAGIPWHRRMSLFHTLINMSWTQFMILALLGFVITNIIFALLYFSFGIEQIGKDSDSNAIHDFMDCFFFSVQTVTTVGYGILHPTSYATNLLAALESLFGWMAFAVLTGLLYGRFSKPTAYLLFSKNAVVAPYKDGQALMFRLAPYKNNTLTEAEVLLNVSFRLHENGKVVNKFFPLPAEISKISALSLNWTVVHPINEHSPFYGMCKEDYSINQTEIMVFIKAFDEHFSNTVQQRTSYTADEILHGAKFKQMFRQSDDRKTTVLELNKLDDTELINESKAS
jgi:inward rectifier potassium channel